MNTFRYRSSLARILALVAGMLLAGCSPSSTPTAPAPPQNTFQGVDITGAEYAKVLSLTDADGARRTLDEFKGKVVVVFFGFTQCPDVCPTTLAELAEARRLLGADGDRVQGIFVSVDPERDTPGILKSYVESFGTGFIGLRGTPDEIKAVAREFKVFYMKVPGKTETSYTMDHTAGSYVFDTQGRVRLFVRYGAGPKAVADDIRKLFAEAS